MKGEVDLRVGNGARVAALTIGTYDLTLLSGLFYNYRIVIMFLL